MFNIKHTFIIQYPSKRFGFVGSVPAVLGAETPATNSDVLGGRAYCNAAGELMAVNFPSFATRDDALNFAASKGVEVRE